MATITVNTDQNYSALTTLVDNDIISLTASARLTIDTSTVDVRRWDCITDGEFYVENTTTTPRFIHVGSTGTNPRIRLEAGGRWTCRGELITIGTSDGTANQTFTLPTDGAEEYGLLGGVFVDMPTPDTLLLTPEVEVPRLMARVEDLTNALGHERRGAVFEHDIANNRIVFGDGTGGWIPPNGAVIKVPNIQIKCTNTSTAQPIFDLALSGRLDWDGVSISGGTTDVTTMNCDFDNGAGQTLKNCCIHSKDTTPINFNVNAGRVTLENVVLSVEKELIVSAGAVPPSVLNLFLMSRYNLNNDYGIECFNNTGGTFDNIVVVQGDMSNGSASRGAWAGSSQNVTIGRLWTASYNPACYFATGASNCVLKELYPCGRGSRSQGLPSTKTAVVRTTTASNITVENIINDMTIAEGYMSHREALMYCTAGSKDVTLLQATHNANGQLDHITNESGSNTRIANVTIEGQLLNKVSELQTASSGMKMYNLEFEDTQTNGTSTEFGFGTQYLHSMVKNRLTTAVGTGTDCTSSHYFLNENFDTGRLEVRMSPSLNELDYYTEVIKTGKIVFNQNNRLYIENNGDQVILTSRVHGGITGISGSGKGGSGTGDFSEEISMRRPNGTWTAWLAFSTANASTQIASLPADADNRIQVRFRITKTNGGLVDYLNGIYLTTTCDNTYREPFFLTQAEINLSSIVPGSRVLIRDTTDPQNKIILFNEIASSSDFVKFVGFTANLPLEIRVRNASGVDKYKPYEAIGTLTANGYSLVVNQERDD